MNDREKWRERSGISVLAARHDDEDTFSKVSSLKLNVVRELELIYFQSFGHWTPPPERRKEEKAEIRIKKRQEKNERRQKKE